jgi:hypothetical protein
MAATPKENVEQWLDLILLAPDRAGQLRAVTALIDDVHRKTRNRAERIVQNALIEIGHGEG